MHGYSFSLKSAQLTALSAGLLWWADRKLLCVSDLHLGKSERIARRGGSLLPPYENKDTLTRLASAVNALNPVTVICLGDSFDDLKALDGLNEDDHASLAALMSGRRWIWIEGNHDGILLFSGRKSCNLACIWSLHWGFKIHRPCIFTLNVPQCFGDSNGITGAADPYAALTPLSPRSFKLPKEPTSTPHVRNAVHKLPYKIKCFQWDAQEMCAYPCSA